MSVKEPEGPPIFDPGNPFAGALYPTIASFGLANTDAGPLLVVTIRSGPTTLTMHLDRDAAVDLARRFTINAEKVPILHVAKDGLVVPHRHDRVIPRARHRNTPGQS